MEMTRESVIDYYKTLCEQSKLIKVGTTARLEGHAREFNRVHCFRSTEGVFVSGCMKVIGFDVCFLNIECDNQLSTAVGVDGNNGTGWAVKKNRVQLIYFFKGSFQFFFFGFCKNRF